MAETLTPPGNLLQHPDFAKIYANAVRYLSQSPSQPAVVTAKQSTPFPAEQPRRIGIMSRRQALRRIAAVTGTALAATIIPPLILGNKSPSGSIELVEAPVAAANAEFEITPEAPTMIRHIEAEVRPVENLSIEETPIETASKAKIFYPQELSYTEVKRQIGMLRNSHDAVLTESLFLKELAQFPQEKREQILKELARAHARAIVEHYGLSHAIIGLDPGHGGTDIGAGATTVEGTRMAEKDATWELANLTAQELWRESEGKYDTIILRPEIPQDEDIDGDGLVSNVERIQKRKALLVTMAEALRLPEEDEERKVAYISLHFNGESSGTIVGAETYFPNDFAMQNEKHRASSEALAKLLQANIVQALRNAGYDVVDRGARVDPDRREPLTNSDNKEGPYLALGSPKLDRDLTRV